jgi:hypothetical protein
MGQLHISLLDSSGFLEDMGNKILWEAIEQHQTYLHTQASQVKTLFSSAATVNTGVFSSARSLFFTEKGVLCLQTPFPSYQGA